MKRAIGLTIATLVISVAQDAAAAETLRVGFCAKTVTSAASPYAIANKMGWFAEAGFTVELVPLPGSTDCVKYVGTGEIRYALPSVEPLAAIRPQGLKAKVFYTAYQSNTYGPAVPANSPIKTLGDLKGKTIGVASMASGGVPVARALAAMAGLDPERDITLVVVGEGAQAAALVRSRQVDALSLYDTMYVIIENLGIPLRRIEASEIARYPGNGFVALDETLVQHRAEAVALARGYAMGTVFAMANPEAAVRILWEVFPYTKPTGKDEATALGDDVRTLVARLAAMRLERAGVKRWGENSPENYQAYLDFLVKWGVIKQPIAAAEVTTNDLIADINTFDVAKVAAEAKAYK